MSIFRPNLLGIHWGFSRSTPVRYMDIFSRKKTALVAWIFSYYGLFLIHFLLHCHGLDLDSFICQFSLWSILIVKCTCTLSFVYSLYFLHISYVFHMYILLHSTIVGLEACRIKGPGGPSHMCMGRNVRDVPIFALKGHSVSNIEKSWPKTQ